MQTNQSKAHTPHHLLSLPVILPEASFPYPPHSRARYRQLETAPPQSPLGLLALASPGRLTMPSHSSPQNPQPRLLPTLSPHSICSGPAWPSHVRSCTSWELGATTHLFRGSCLLIVGLTTSVTMYLLLKTLHLMQRDSGSGPVGA